MLVEQLFEEGPPLLELAFVAAKMSSQSEGSKTTPGFAPTASTAVSSSTATAPRFVFGRT